MGDQKAQYQPPVALPAALSSDAPSRKSLPCELTRMGRPRRHGLAVLRRMASINVFGGIPGEVVSERGLFDIRRRRRQHVSAITITEVSRCLRHTEFRHPARISARVPAVSGSTSTTITKLAAQAGPGGLDAFSRIQGASRSRSVHPTLPSPQTFGYRNHARFTIRDSGMLGFINRITRRFIKVDRVSL